MSQIFTNIIVSLGLLALIGFGYFLYSQNGEEYGVTTIDQTAINSQQFIRQIGTLQDLELDTSLFRESDFLTLTSYEEPVVPVAVGNSNPF